METQNKLLKDYLRSGKSITSLEAIKLWGILRLSARVHNLRSSGLNVKSKFITVKNRFNKDVTVKRYFL